MKANHLIAAAVVAAFASSFTFAADAAPAPDLTVTANVSLVTDYYFRGLTQTWHKPAIQGGADLSHSSGVYAGIWSSNVSNHQYLGGSQEIDYYFGYNGKINDDAGYTVGFYGYYYPSAKNGNTKFDTQELNIGANWKWFSAKYSHSMSDYFGANTDTGYNGNTKGTGYLDLNATINLADDVVLLGHVGITRIKSRYSNLDPSYKDYKLGITKSFKDGWNIGAAYVKSTNSAFYDNTISLVKESTDTADLGSGRFVVSAGRTF